jgi:hypothetical protein
MAVHPYGPSVSIHKKILEVRCRMLATFVTDLDRRGASFDYAWKIGVHNSIAALAAKPPMPIILLIVT